MEGMTNEMITQKNVVQVPAKLAEIKKIVEIKVVRSTCSKTETNLYRCNMQDKVLIRKQPKKINKKRNKSTKWNAKISLLLNLKMP